MGKVTRSQGDGAAIGRMALGALLSCVSAIGCGGTNSSAASGIGGSTAPSGNTSTIGGTSPSLATVATGGAATATTLATGGTATATNVATGGAATATTLATGGTANTSAGASVDCGAMPISGCTQPTPAETLQSRDFLILLDKSGSMNTAAAEGATSRWTWTADALMRSLNATDKTAYFGLILFPYSATGEALTCEHEAGASAVNVPVQPASSAVPQILATIAATTPKGGTPTAAALSSALEYYSRGAGKSLTGFKYIVLVTDGGPNCNPTISCPTDTCTAKLDHLPGQQVCWNGAIPNCCDPAIGAAGAVDPRALCLDDLATVTALKALNAIGVETFVVGIPGTEAYASYLDQFAEAGGAPLVGKLHKYYAVTNGAELTEAISSITSSTVHDCSFPLSQAIASPEKLNVAVDCQIIPRSTGGQVNWTYEATTQTILFQGPQCVSMRAQGTRRVDTMVGCATQVN